MVERLCSRRFLKLKRPNFDKQNLNVTPVSQEKQPKVHTAPQGRRGGLDPCLGVGLFRTAPSILGPCSG